MSGRETNLTKNMSYDRILKLKANGVPSPKVDQRILEGTNNVHAKMDPEYGHWFVTLDHGTPPPALQQRFTSFPRLVSFVTEYYKKRNIIIEDIIDT